MYEATDISKSNWISIGQGSRNDSGNDSDYEVNLGSPDQSSSNLTAKSKAELVKVSAEPRKLSFNEVVNSPWIDNNYSLVNPGNVENCVVSVSPISLVDSLSIPGSHFANGLTLSDDEDDEVDIISHRPRNGHIIDEEFEDDGGDEGEDEDDNEDEDGEEDDEDEEDDEEYEYEEEEEDDDEEYYEKRKRSRTNRIPKSGANSTSPPVYKREGNLLLFASGTADSSGANSNSTSPPVYKREGNLLILTSSIPESGKSNNSTIYSEDNNYKKRDFDSARLNAESSDISLPKPSRIGNVAKLIPSRQGIVLPMAPKTQTERFKQKTNDSKWKHMRTSNDPHVNPLLDLNIIIESQRRPFRSIKTISRIEFYNLDGTLLQIPVPNSALFTKEACEIVQTHYGLYDGGWWADPLFLDGMLRDDGTGGNWWSRSLLKIIKDSAKRSDTLTILYSGRIRETNRNVVIDLLLSRKSLLGAFDAVILRPDGATDSRFTNAKFIAKTLESIVEHYLYANSIAIYDNNTNNGQEITRIFRESRTWRGAAGRFQKDLYYRIYAIEQERVHFKPSFERQLIIAALEQHNSAVRAKDLHEVNKFRHEMILEPQVQETHYIFEKESINKLIEITERIEDKENFTIHCDRIIVQERGEIDEKKISEIGPIGRKVEWKLTHIGELNGFILALRVEPVNQQTVVHCIHNPTVTVLLKHKDHPNIQPEQIKDWRKIENTFSIYSKLHQKKLLNIREVKKMNHELLKDST